MLDQTGQLFICGTGTDVRLRDSDLRRVVLETLANNPATCGLELRVGVHHGIAHLGGSVSSLDHWRRAEAVVSSVPGIHGVVNRIEAPGAPSTDRVIHLPSASDRRGDT